jgi:hypothetical protein
MPGDFPGGILSVDASPCTEGRDQRVVDEARADSQLLVTEEVIDPLTLFWVKEFPLVLWAFSFPIIDGSRYVVGNPDPERATVFPGRNLEVKQFDRSALGRVRS